MCRVLNVPSDMYLWSALSGALLDLTRPDNWEAFGSVTPAETAERMRQMVQDFWDITPPCATMTTIDTFQHVENQNVAGGSLTISPYSRVPFNSIFGGNAGNVTVNVNAFTIAPGRYFVDMRHQIYLGSTTAFYKPALSEVDNPTNVFLWGVQDRVASDSRLMHITGQLLTAVELELAFYALATAARATNGYGVPANISGMFEWYGGVSFLRVSDD